jgi:hypothetical protein
MTSSLKTIREEINLVFLLIVGLTCITISNNVLSFQYVIEAGLFVLVGFNLFKPTIMQALSIILSSWVIGAFFQIYDKSHTLGISLIIGWAFVTACSGWIPISCGFDSIK